MSRPLVIKPGPKRLASALRLAGFSANVKLPAVTDRCGTTWQHPSELQVILALAGGESSGNAAAYHVNPDGSADSGALQINDRAHASYFGPQTAPTGWLWIDWIDNAKAARDVYVAAGHRFTPWVAYGGGGYLSERYKGRSWMDWSAFGVAQMAAALAAYTAQGKAEGDALALIASVADDPLVYTPLGVP